MRMLEIPHLSPDDIFKYILECLNENNLDPGLIDYKKKDAKLPTEEEEGCFLACMDKKMKLMKADGTYDEDIILSNAQTPDQRLNMKKKFDEILTKCKIEADGDLCKLSACINKQPYNFYV